MSSILPGAPEKHWAAAAIGDRGACVEIKAVWALTVALAAFFAFTAIAAAALARRMRRMEEVEARLARRDVERC
jgi:membrane protein implicated in regulation of membrane protease activity